MQDNKLSCQLHGCCQKAWDSWVWEEGFYYSWHKNSKSFVFSFVLVCPFSVIGMQRASFLNSFFFNSGLSCLVISACGYWFYRSQPLWGNVWEMFLYCSYRICGLWGEMQLCSTAWNSILLSILFLAAHLYSGVFFFVSSSLHPHGLQHTKPPCPSLSPGVCPSSCPSHR